MADIFISYASKDRAKAQQIAHVLEAKGWSVFWDRTILPGETFDNLIEAELESAKCVLVLWSSAAVSSNWVKEEAEVGLKRGILVPALIQGDKVPMGFRRLQAAILTDWSGQSSHPELEKLFKAVGASSGTRGGEAADSASDLKAASAPATARQPGSKTRMMVWPDDPGIFVDARAGLMWTRQDNGADISWKEAEEYAQNLRLGGYGDWRLPTIEELENLYDPGSAISYRIKKPFNLTGSWIWSSSGQGPDGGLGFSFHAGARNQFRRGYSGSPRVLCVRGQPSRPAVDGVAPPVVDRPEASSPVPEEVIQPQKISTTPAPSFEQTEAPRVLPPKSIWSKLSLGTPLRTAALWLGVAVILLAGYFMINRPRPSPPKAVTVPAKKVLVRPRVSGSGQTRTVLPGGHYSQNAWALKTTHVKFGLQAYRGTTCEVHVDHPLAGDHQYLLSAGQVKEASWFYGAGRIRVSLTCPDREARLKVRIW